jgi:quercetin dioxygenase-like cupin family protein
MRRYQPGLLVLFLLAAASVVIPQTGHKGKHSSASAARQEGHTMITPDQLKWGPAPPSLPPGSQLAVLEGDPSKAGGSFTIRAKLPDGDKFPPHWHPTIERIVVLEGTLGMGLGEKFDPAAGHELTAGSFAAMPKGVRHFAWAKGETLIQVSGVGPFEVIYVNPADDPRKAPKP